jgi:DNA repair exonuclease SbcCD ATPase subunit
VKYREIESRHCGAAAELARLERSAVSALSEFVVTSKQLQKINGEIGRKVAAAAVARNGAIEADRALNVFANVQQRGLWKLEEELEEELERAKAAPNVVMIEITKKKALIGQLERKLDDMRAALRQLEEGPAAAGLRARQTKETGELEVEQEEYAHGKERAAGLRTLLELKERVIEDLGTLCPFNSNVKARPGLEEPRYGGRPAGPRTRNQ